MLGELGEPGVCPPSSASTEILSSEEILRLASSGRASAKGGKGPKADELLREAAPEVKQSWLHGPRRYATDG